MSDEKNYLHQLEEIQTLLSYALEEARTFHKQIENNGNVLIFNSRPGHDLEQEFSECDNRLRFIIYSYALAIYLKFGRKTTINFIERTQAEQDNIYLNVKKFAEGMWITDTEAIEKYRIERWKSPHQSTRTGRCRGIDFSDNEMTPEEIEFTDSYLGDNQVVYTGELNTLLRHSVGQYGNHYHIQVDTDEFTSIRRASL